MPESFPLNSEHFFEAEEKQLPWREIFKQYGDTFHFPTTPAIADSSLEEFQRLCDVLPDPLTRTLWNIGGLDEILTGWNSFVMINPTSSDTPLSKEEAQQLVDQTIADRIRFIWSGAIPAAKIPFTLRIINQNTVERIELFHPEAFSDVSAEEVLQAPNGMRDHEETFGLLSGIPFSSCQAFAQLEEKERQLLFSLQNLKEGDTPSDEFYKLSQKTQGVVQEMIHWTREANDVIGPAGMWIANEHDFHFAIWRHYLFEQMKQEYRFELTSET